MATSTLTGTLRVSQHDTLPYTPDFSVLRDLSRPSSSSHGTLLTSPEKPPRHVDVWTSFTSKFSLLPPEIARLVLKGIYAAQETLGDKETKTIQPTETFRYTIQVDPFGFLVCPSDSSGRGGYGTVYVGNYFSTKRTTLGEEIYTPTKPKPQARKVSNERSLRRGSIFSPAKEKVRGYIEEASPHKKDLFGGIHHTSVGAGRSYALMDAFPHHFGEIDWANLLRPAQYLIRMTGLVTQALSVIHKKGDVHRDVKESNVMVDEKTTAEPDSIKLIDYDTARGKFERRGYTTGTSEYLNPSSFGNAETTLINQRKRQGIQRPCDDMFAFFHMGIRMTLKLCKKLIPTSDTETRLAITSLYTPQFLTPEVGDLFSDDELKEIGLKYSRHHVYYTHTMFPQKVAVLPSAEIYRDTLPKILKKLPLPSSAQTILWSYVSYCIEHKFASDESRDSALMADYALKQLLNTPVVDVKDEPSAVETMRKKRRIEEESPKTLPPQSTFNQAKNRQRTF